MRSIADDFGATFKLITAGFGHDRIYDFTPTGGTHDVVDLHGRGLTSFAQLAFSDDAIGKTLHIRGDSMLLVSSTRSRQHPNSSTERQTSPALRGPSGG